MRYAQGHNEETRERILATASRLFRAHGIAAVGLAKIMAKADLTVGTFYTHFKSKEALVRDALVPAFRLRHADLDEALRTGGLEEAVRVYLSPGHRDLADEGCAAASLASELARHPRATRQAFVANMVPTLERFAELLAARRRSPVSMAEATAFFALLLGTLQLARATPDGAASDAILAAGIRNALAIANGLDGEP